MDAFDEGYEARRKGLARNSHNYNNKGVIRDWRRGWDAMDCIIREKEETEKWDNFAQDCPWYDDSTCLCKVGNFCSSSNCAIKYFIENYNE